MVDSLFLMYNAAFEKKTQQPDRHMGKYMDSHKEMKMAFKHMEMEMSAIQTKRNAMWNYTAKLLLSYQTGKNSSLTMNWGREG